MVPVAGTVTGHYDWLRGHALAGGVVARLEADLHGGGVLRGDASSVGCGGLDLMKLLLAQLNSLEV